MELVPFPEETPESLPCVDIVRRHCLQARRKLSPEIKSAGTLILNFPTSRAVRNEHMLFNPPSPFILLLIAKTD